MSWPVVLAIVAPCCAALVVMTWIATRPARKGEP